MNLQFKIRRTRRTDGDDEPSAACLGLLSRRILGKALVSADSLLDLQLNQLIDSDKSCRVLIAEAMAYHLRSRKPSQTQPATIRRFRRRIGPAKRQYIYCTTERGALPYKYIEDHDRWSLIDDLGSMFSSPRYGTTIVGDILFANCSDRHQTQYSVWERDSSVAAIDSDHKHFGSMLTLTLCV